MSWKKIAFATILSFFCCLGSNTKAVETNATFSQPYRFESEQVFHNASMLPATNPLYRAPFRKTKALQAEENKLAYFLNAEYLNWQIRRSDLDFAISGNLNLGGGLDNAIRHEVKHQSEPGFRLLFGRAIDDNWNIGFGLTTYSADENATVVAGTGLVYATLTNPYQFDTQIGRADASSKFDQRIYDLHVSRQVVIGEKPNVLIFGSLRFTDHDSIKRVDYFDLDEVSPLSNIITKTSSTGFGIRIGGEGTWDIVENTYMFAAGETSLLLNRVTTTTVNTRTPSVGDDVVNSVIDNYTQPLSVIGASVGFGYKLDSLNIRLGYEINSWFNLGARTAITNDVSASYYSYNREESDVMVEGVFLRCNWQF